MLLCSIVNGAIQILYCNCDGQVSMITDDNASQWKSGKFDACSLKKPWTNRHLNVPGWLRRGPLPEAKFYHDRITPFALQIWENAHQLVTPLVFVVLLSAYSQDPCTEFYPEYVKSRLFAQGCAFGSLENKIISFGENYIVWPHIPTKAEIFGQFLTGLRKLHAKKALTMGMLNCKLPLIVIVAPRKLYSE